MSRPKTVHEEFMQDPKNRELFYKEALKLEKEQNALLIAELERKHPAALREAFVAGATWRHCRIERICPEDATREAVRRYPDQKGGGSDRRTEVLDLR